MSRTIRQFIQTSGKITISDKDVKSKVRKSFAPCEKVFTNVKHYDRNSKMDNFDREMFKIFEEN